MFSIYSAVAVSYLVGAVPTALIAGYVLGGVDIRTTGSGNAGATNLYRNFGLKPYVAVLGLDILKGWFAASVVASWTATELLEPVQATIVCGLAAVIGHIYTVFASFRGGKGVATAGGVMLAIAPLPLLAAVAVYLAVLAYTHYVSMGSIAAAVSVPVSMAAAMYFLDTDYPREVYLLATALAFLIVYTHRGNISRLMKGEEAKTYFFGKG